MVIWVTGLSGSGKTRLCCSLYQLLKPRMEGLVLLDGDVIRAAFGNDIGYREEDRILQVRRLQGIAKVLSDQDLVVIVAVLYAHPDLLTWNRNNLNDYFEVYLEASLDTLRARDYKCLYAMAASGEISNVVGHDIPWHVPISPDLVIDANQSEDPDTLARRVIAAVPRLAHVL